MQDMTLEAILRGQNEEHAAEITRLRTALAEAEARSAALVAGAYEAAAKACNDRGVAEQVNYGLGRETQNYYRARDTIRALTDADATAALARLIAEARAEGMREAAGLIPACGQCGGQETILAAAKEAKP